MHPVWFKYCRNNTDAQLGCSDSVIVVSQMLLIIRTSIRKLQNSAPEVKIKVPRLPTLRFKLRSSTAYHVRAHACQAIR